MFDLALIAKAQFFLDLDLDPQALAVEAVLVALPVALHGFEALIEIFIGAPPGVMNPHGIVRGNRTIEKRILFIALRVTL